MLGFKKVPKNNPKRGPLKAMRPTDNILGP